MIRVAGWTLLQAAVFILVFELGLSWWKDAHGLRFDIGRGILWQYYTYGFIGLAGCANGVLTLDRIGSVRWKRLATWTIALIPLTLFTLPSWSTLPLAVPFIHGCAVLSILAREGFGLLGAPAQTVTKP